MSQTTQEAYIEVAALLAQAKEATDKAFAISKAHGLLIGVRERDEAPEVLNPKFYTIEEKSYQNRNKETITYKEQTLRKDLTEEEIDELARAFDSRYPDPEWIRERIEEEEETSLEELWVPSQFC